MKIIIVRTGKAENGGKTRGFTGVGTARKTNHRILTTRTGGPRVLGLNEVHCAERGLSKLLRTPLIILSCSSLYCIVYCRVIFHPHLIGNTHLSELRF